MNKVIPDYSALSQLLGCYFHQDWIDEFDDDLSVIAAIVESEPRDQIDAGVEEINQLLRVKHSEDDLRMIMTGKVGCYFEPSSIDMTYSEWLCRIKEAFSK